MGAHAGKASSGSPVLQCPRTPGGGTLRPYMGETVRVRKDPIRMYQYDPDWASSFEREQLRLTPLCSRTWFGRWSTLAVRQFPVW